MKQNNYIDNSFEDEVLILSATTLNRLFNISNDCAVLYVFYISVAKFHQDSSDIFARQHLKWPKKRFYYAKKLLLDNNLISEEGGNLKILFLV